MRNKYYMKLAVRDGLFASHSGITPDSFSPQFVSGNGWRATAYGDGSIRCSYIIDGKDGKKEEEILFKVTRAGYVTSNRRLKNGQSIPMASSYKLSEWPADGVIVLVDGGRNESYGYFYKTDYKGLAEQYGIDEVKIEDPNQLHTLYNLSSEAEKYTFTERLITDGQAEKIGANHGKSEEWNAAGIKNIELYEMYRVSSAQWVIIIEDSSDRGTRKTLFTMSNPSKLIINIPQE